MLLVLQLFLVPFLFSKTGVGMRSSQKLCFLLNILRCCIHLIAAYVSRNSTMDRPTMLAVTTVTDLVWLCALFKTPGSFIATVSRVLTSNFSSDADAMLLSKSRKCCKSSNTIKPSPSASSSNTIFFVGCVSSGVRPKKISQSSHQ